MIFQVFDHDWTLIDDFVDKEAMLLVPLLNNDHQPFFRIFNPTAQGQRWDPDGRYVHQWVPELRNVASADVHAAPAASPHARDYPAPIIDHADRRVEALEAYRRARTGNDTEPGP